MSRNKGKWVTRQKFVPRRKDVKGSVVDLARLMRKAAKKNQRHKDN